MMFYMLFVFQYKEQRMEQEKDLLQGQVTWLNTELKAKSEELLSLSRQRGNEILELQCNLNNKEDEVLYLLYIVFMYFKLSVILSDMF